MSLPAASGQYFSLNCVYAGGSYIPAASMLHHQRFILPYKLSECAALPNLQTKSPSEPKEQLPAILMRDTVRRLPQDRLSGQCAGGKLKSLTWWRIIVMLVHKYLQRP